jgi:hypothetical protein
MLPPVAAEAGAAVAVAAALPDDGLCPWHALVARSKTAASAPLAARAGRHVEELFIPGS